MTNDLSDQSNDIVSAVSGKTIAKNNGGLVVKNKAAVEAWSISLQTIYDNDTVRLDASHYDQATTFALADLTGSGFQLDVLSKLADVRLPGQFVRIWADDENTDIPTSMPLT